ncbi:alpha-ketoglutarate dehydrogenase component 4-like isoform X2 [Babylonia areolata]|uniref:alpha-ketoglutarate dehydrogenase component 4-like isoform X2 n=1 Tax=Babylonia areolata TaxID=304850 RepID=UPI003FCFD87B
MRPPTDIMAAAVRTLKTVRPHIPLIRFPARGPALEYKPDPSPAGSTVNQVSSTPASAAVSKPVGSTPRGSGIDDVNLPKKYQRKLIDVDEMEFIERGGPA